MIQLPEDMLRMQEVIWAVQPDVIVETGVAHGGSLVFYRQPVRGHGPGEWWAWTSRSGHNRRAIRGPSRWPAASPWSEGSSTDPGVVAGCARWCGRANAAW